VVCAIVLFVSTQAYCSWKEQQTKLNPKLKKLQENIGSSYEEKNIVTL
jgi:hypothetical protein